MNRAGRAGFDATLSDLRDRIVAELPAQLQSMLAVTRRLAVTSGEKRPTLLRELERSAHGIAGRAAMFGLPEVMQAALDVEKLAGRLGEACVPAQTRGAPDAADAEALGDVVERFARACASASVPDERPVTH
jgi:HPt (histidine-containing phosphotransfer) domain-containing protein